MSDPDPQADRVRLRHMLHAARAALAFTSDKSRDDLSADLMLQFALIRAFEIIGEAAARVTEPTRVAHPEIPWGAVIGMRNRLIHGYFDVDLAIIWRTTTTSLPPLIAALESFVILPTTPAEDRPS